MDLCLWLKIKYESAAKLGPLRIYYAEKIRSLKFSYDGSLPGYIGRFQGLAILWQAIDTTTQLEHRLVTQTVEEIEDPLFSDPCKIIKNWVECKKTFRDAAAMLCAH